MRRPFMRSWLGLAGAVAVLMWACGVGLGAARFAQSPAKPAGATEVDVELVMAVDISYSMDYDELALQRDGYVQAVGSTEFLNALKQGTHGKVAITLVEWAGAN